MHIHKRKQNESVQDIAEIYGISEENLRNLNEIYEGEPATGEELLILTPTRSYTVQYGDTPERISLRFGIRKSDIFTLNPWLIEEGLTPGRVITLKYDNRPYGMAMANGYCYKGCSEEMLRRALPFLTYVSFCSASADERGIRQTFDDRKHKQIVKDERKIPLVRVFDRYTDRYKNKKDLTYFAEELIDLAKKGGYKGIIMDACSLSDSAKEFSAFLMILRKIMIGCDLILITEIDENSPIEFSEYADGSIMYYPKYAMENQGSFDEGERRVMADFACRGESAKAFIDLPSLVQKGAEYFPLADAMKTARRAKLEIQQNESTLLSHFRDRNQGEYVYSSLNNIKALLELVSEFDYMGVCFDIMRTPLSHMMMFNSMFKTSYLFSENYRVRSREGCSRGDEE